MPMAKPQPEPIRSHTAPAAIHTEPAAAPPIRQVAAIGASMTIKGEIRTREELFVDGEVEGSMESQSLVTVGPQGKVRANIKAREVVIYGEVKGNVEVSQKLAIREQGSLVGDVKSAGISIDDGAYFKGNIDIVRVATKGA